MPDAGVDDRGVPPPPPIMDVAVIVATLNRVHHLRRALGSLESARVPSHVTLEVIVVDNNSWDSTRDLVNDFTTAANIRLRYLSERHRGKSAALNTAIRASSAHILAFTDDDCLVDAKWIEAMVAAFRGDRSLDGIGGRVELYDPTDRPICIQTDPNPKMCSPATLFSSIMGCNMALRRRVFDDVGLFDPMFGPGLVACCEDIDLVYRAQRKGLKFMYLPEMLVYHNHGRRTDDDVRRVQRQYIAGHGAFYAKHILRGDRVAFELAAHESSATIGSTVRLYARRREYLRKLSWFVQGFLYGLVASCRALGSGTRKRHKG